MNGSYFSKDIEQLTHFTSIPLKRHNTNLTMKLKDSI